MNELELSRLRVDLLRAAIEKVTGTSDKPEGNQTEFGRLLGYKDGAFVRQMLAGGKAVTEKTVRKVESLPGMEGWFTSREQGSVDAPTQHNHKTSSSDLPVSAPKVPLIKDSPTGRSHRINGNHVESDSANVSALPREIPVLSYEMAVQMTPQLDPYTLGEPLGTETIHKPQSAATFAVPIKDASMAPNFEPGREVVIIDPAWRPKPGKFVLARTRAGEAVFRKYREIGLNEAGAMVFELAPLNSDFATLHSERDGLAIIGVMAGYTHYEDE